MGHLTEDILIGLSCQECGQYFEDECGFPRTCDGCQYEDAVKHQTRPTLQHPSLEFEAVDMRPVYALEKRHKERTRNTNKEAAREAFMNAECAVDEHTEYHWKIYKNGQRIDYYPTSNKYHVIATNKRGQMEPVKIAELFNQ